jgi:hypothetical protein
MSMTDQQKHDLLLEMRPDGANHDEAVCMHCTRKASEEENVANEDQAIFSQEQHEQLMATAVEKATTEATAEADAEVLSLNAKLVDATKAMEDTILKVDTLEQAIADATELERLSVLEGERVAAVEAVVNFSEEQIAKRKESWAKMSVEDFDSYLEDIQEVATASAKPKEENAPKTEFSGVRATAGDEGTELSVVKTFFNSGLDVASQS